MLALETAGQTDLSAEKLLEMRGVMGWGNSA
jgi:hypothetical protein